MIGARLRQQVLAHLDGELVRRRVHLRQVRIAGRQHVAVDVAAGRERVEQRGIDRLHRALHVRLDDAVELERLARRQAQRVVGVGAGDGVERQPLLRRRHAARQAHADHEAVGLLQHLLGALGTHVAVVLQIRAVELRQLRVVFGDRAGDDVRQALGNGAAQEPAVLFDDLVLGAIVVGHLRCPVGRAGAPSVSIHVALIAAGFGELFQLGAARFIIATRGLGENAAEHHVDVARHALLVAAHIDVGALVDPLQ